MSNEVHAGVIHISDNLVREIGISVDAADTQGILRDKGIFAEVLTHLLLPETYIVHNLFYEWRYRVWSVLVEGPDLPLAIEGTELQEVTPVYQRNVDGSTSLVRIDTSLSSEDAARKRIDDLRAEVYRLETWLIERENAV